jgi:hypothetical protein
MKVILHGKELRCCAFADVPTRGIITVGDVPYVKMANGSVFNLCSTGVENYGNQKIEYWPDAELVLDPCDKLQKFKDDSKCYKSE